jgi:ABC-2 type transport system ATP-binding protein
MTGVPASDAVVAVRRVGKVYRPTPRAMRMFVRTTIYSDVVALEDVDLEVPGGSIVALVGPNGAGKTTLFRILTGLTTPTTGSAHVLGLDVDSQSLAVRKLIGFMPAEDRSLFMRMTCLENLLFHARLQHLPRKQLSARCLETLDQVGLAGRSRSSVFSLSAGMRARLQLARAILHRPRLLILDEPTGAVDPVGAQSLLELVQRLVREHDLAALISSHRLEEIEALGSNVILLDRGRIRYHGDLDRLRGQWQRPHVELEFATRELAGAAASRIVADGFDVQVDDVRLACHLGSGSTTGQLLWTLGPLAAQLVHVREQPTPLRDILTQMYSDGRREYEEAR